MKIQYKFFILFSFNALLIITLMAVVVYIFHYKDFMKNIDKLELNSLNHFAQALIETYQKNNGWDVLKKDHQKWTELVVTYLDKDRIARHGDNKNNFTMNKTELNDRELSQIQQKKTLKQFIVINDPKKPQVKMLPMDPMQLGLRLFLVDNHKNYVAGNKVKNDLNYLRTLMIENNIIGYIGLSNPIGKIQHPLNTIYLQTQLKIIYAIGCGVLIISVILSYLISRRILKPIDELVKGTDAVKSLEFDITINVRSNDELGYLSKNFNHMIETLNHYERIRKQLMTDISHEIRTPLTVIRCTIEAMIDGIIHSDEKNLFSVKSELILLGKLVDDIHMLSLADAKSLPIKKEFIHPIDALIKVLDLFQSELERNQMTVQTNLDVMEYVLMHGDTSYLVRLFSNLVSNTLKYTDSGGLLKIKSSIHNNRLIICFDDSKPGVPDSALNRLFDRLFRVDKSRSHDLGSSGLGLSICKEIVEIHEGSIQANHSKSGGLQIVLDFPIKGE